MNGSHEDGGKHISGGERLIPFHEMKHTVNALLEKGLSHSRGKPDFMQIQFEEVHESIKTIQPLPVHTNEVSCPEEGQKLACQYCGKLSLEKIPFAKRGFFFISLRIAIVRLTLIY